MAKISQLPLLPAPTGNETVVVVAGGVTYRAVFGPLVVAGMNAVVASLAMQAAQLAATQQIIVDHVAFS